MPTGTLSALWWNNMTILIRSEGAKLFLKLPTRLLLNRATASISLRALKKKNIDVELSPQDIRKLVKSIRSCKKQYRKMELVRVESSNGDKVIVKL